jgi:transaldolase
MYVVELVAPNVVNTMPESTLNAMADHGELHGDTVHGSYDAARRVFEDLAGLGIGYDDVVKVLEDEGVAKFKASWQELLDTIKSEMGGDDGGRG